MSAYDPEPGFSNSDSRPAEEPAAVTEEQAAEEKPAAKKPAKKTATKKS